jgi:hypothetical protein
MYTTLAGLSNGDQVTFSGRFIHDSKDCIEEQSLIDENGLETPDSR